MKGSNTGLGRLGRGRPHSNVHCDRPHVGLSVEPRPNEAWTRVHSFHSPVHFQIAVVRVPSRNIVSGPFQAQKHTCQPYFIGRCPARHLRSAVHKYPNWCRHMHVLAWQLTWVRLTLTCISGGLCGGSPQASVNQGYGEWRLEAVHAQRTLFGGDGDDMIGKE